MTITIYRALEKDDANLEVVHGGHGGGPLVGVCKQQWCSEWFLIDHLVQLQTKCRRRCRVSRVSRRQLGRWQGRWLVLSTGGLCRRRSISISVVVSGVLLMIIVLLLCPWRSGPRRRATSTKPSRYENKFLTNLVFLAHKHIYIYK